MIVDKIRKMFDHQEIVENYSKHINTIAELFNIYKVNKLKELRVLEDTLDKTQKEELNL